jgi:two-component system sensor histidine kinase UhpB
MPLRHSHLSILIIEDNPADLFLISNMLLSSGTGIRDIHTASRIDEAFQFLQDQPVDIVVLDLSLPDSFGVDSFLKIKPVTKEIPVIILTGESESDIALEVIKLGAQDYLVKGEFKSDLLVKSIQYSIERKYAENKILVSEEKYRQMFYKNPFPTWIYDLGTLQILEVNDAAIKKYGYDRSEFLELTLEEIRMPEKINGPNEYSAGYSLHQKKNGEALVVEVAYYQIDYFGKKAMQAQINDVTEKHRLEKALLSQQQMKQRQITKAVLEAQDDERKIIGTELHDNINQILASAKLYITAAVDTGEREKMIIKGQEYITLAIEEIRKLSKELVTPSFIITGLKYSIEELADIIQETKKIQIHTDLEVLDETDLCKEMKVAIYRIIQEQLNNIVKYAGADKVRIAVKTENGQLLLSINDNGKGFDTHLRRKGIGLTNIQSRAELFHGKVSIDSSLGNGCRLKVNMCIPVAASQKVA